MPRKLKRKTIESLGEFGLIREIKKWVPSSKAVVRGIGDDAAVFRMRGDKYQLLTIDTLVEDVDFRKRQATPQEIGWKALAVNLSDIAAMGGVPKVAVVSLTLPRNTPLKFVRGFYKGMLKLVRRFHVSVVGGDLSRGPKIASSIAVLGESRPKGTVFRKGAQVGDLVCVTGWLGGSILGRHLNFTPRLREGQFLAKHGASAMIDLSDGLAQDLYHLAADHVGFVIEGNKIPIASAARRLAHGNKRKALSHALYDGEDFELLFTISPRRFRRLQKIWPQRFSIPMTEIGRAVRRETKLRAFPKHLGFQHF